jgi:hypothetical protein
VLLAARRLALPPRLLAWAASSRRLVPAAKLALLARLALAALDQRRSSLSA